MSVSSLALKTENKINSFSKSLSGKHWQMMETDPRSVMSLAQKMEISEVVARILVSRGYDEETATDFLKPTLRKFLPDPFSLKDMDKAVSTTLNAIQQHEKIAIFGDYDVDGATSSSILRRYLYSIGIKARLYIPDRLEEGYGPNIGAMESLSSEGVSLLLMVDCGTLAFEPLQAAADLGLKVVVLDHHLSDTKLPKASAIVNPNRVDETLSHNYLAELCAAGVSFLFVVALQKKLRESGFFEGKDEPDLMQLLDLVALGTVCDVMPLKALNRAFVSQGLKLIKSRSNPGMAALMDVAGVTTHPTAYHLGFVVGPRVNAGGRVGESWLGSKLLTTENRFKVKEYASRLHQLNLERQALEKNIIEDASAFIEENGLHKRPILLVSSNEWHPGVIGIVASRLKERFHKPSLVVSYMLGDDGKGSGRSIPGVSLGDVMHKAVAAGHLIQGGGHAMAAGFSVARAKFDAFYDFICELCDKDVASFVPSLNLDGHLALGGVTEALASSIATLEPFGQGNPSPKFALGPVDVMSAVVFGEDHLRLILKDAQGLTLKAVMFRGLSGPCGEFLLTCPKTIYVAGALKLDIYMNRQTVSFIIEDVTVGA